ncbi:MAG: SUMF1/EgtB/PvdO family nonheme iron enzyme, partial [Evtepia sp.]
MTNFDDYKLAIETMSGGKNTVILDDVGMPSVVVPFPKLTYADIMTGGTQEVLPAFIVDGVEQDAIYESKFQNIVMNDRAYSLPLKDPAVDITFDRALTVCRNKGTGWHLHTNALWAAIQNWCYKNNTVPHGNASYNKDANHEHGIPTYKYDSSGMEKVGRTATGSGPETWYHNYDTTGIADLCGNVWEWVAGFRLVNGEIQIIPYGN